MAEGMSILEALKWRTQFVLAVEGMRFLGRAVRDLYHLHRVGEAAEWFDHRLDWMAGPDNWHWTERAVLGGWVIQPGDTVLDLCCGDGFYTAQSFAQFAAHVDGVDVSPEAVGAARSLYAAPNVRFHHGDVVLDDFPRDKYDIVCWFAAIEHLSPGETDVVLGKIAAVLRGSDRAALVGSSILGHLEANPGHKQAFASAGELEALLGRYFETAHVWESRWDAERTDLLFLCRYPLEGVEE